LENLQAAKVEKARKILQLECGSVGSWWEEKMEEERKAELFWRKNKRKQEMTEWREKVEWSGKKMRNWVRKKKNFFE
jgi:hypothetical protein